MSPCDAHGMRAAEAPEIVADLAARYGENREEDVAPRRIVAEDSDETCAALAAETGWAEPSDVIEIRDLWRALAVIANIRNQRGCEVHDPAVTDGKLTTLIDIVVNG